MPATPALQLTPISLYALVGVLWRAGWVGALYGAIVGSVVGFSLSLFGGGFSIALYGLLHGTIFGGTGQAGGFFFGDGVGLRDAPRFGACEKRT